MDGELYSYFFGDHRRLEECLEKAERSDPIEGPDYVEFRSGLLRHIGMEEKILLPAIIPQATAGLRATIDQIRRDHAAIGALLVPPPTARIVSALRYILDRHNVLEETARGLYTACEALPAEKVAEMTAAARKSGDVKVNPFNRDPKVLEATRRALDRAGYDPDELLGPA